MSALDMFGHIDDVFRSATVTRNSKSGSEYVGGKWVEGVVTQTTHAANIQPLSMKEIAQLEIGADRIKDYRKFYINDGSASEISEADTWTIPGVDGTFESFQVDNRVPFGRNYCKVIAARIDV